MNPGLIFFVILAALTGFDRAPAKPSADLLILNARIVTMDAKHLTATAMVIKGNRIVWVGDTAEAQRRFPETRAIDLRGATVLPGIIDAHTHLIGLGKSLVHFEPEGCCHRERGRRTSQAASQLSRAQRMDSRLGLE